MKNGWASNNSFTKFFAHLLRIEFHDLPPDSNLDDLFRARVVSYSSLTLGFFVFLVAVLRLVKTEVSTFSIYVLFAMSFLCFLGPFFYKKYNFYKQGAIFTVVFAFITIFFRSIDTGGLDGVTITWISIFPICSAFLIGKKSVLPVSLICLSLLAFLLLVAEPEGWVIKNEDSHFIKFVILSVLILIHSVLAVIYENEKYKNEMLIRKAHESLAQTKKLAALGTIAGGIAHEINNPLMLILGGAESLKRSSGKSQSLDELKSEVVMRSEKIERSVIRIRSIVDSLLLIGRKNTPKEFKSVDFNSVINCAIEHLNESKKSDVQVKIENPQWGQLKFMGNEVLLVQLVLNLLSNSVDALHETQNPLITISMQMENQKLRVRLKDNGKPLSQEVKDSLFHPFYTSKPVGKGTGLGLILSKTIAQMHGGELEFLPSEVQTTFCLTLPLSNS